MENRYRTYGINNNIYNIELIIKNILKSYFIYTSEIKIYEYSKLYIIKFKIYIYRLEQYKIIELLKKYIKSLLILKLNKNIEINIEKCNNIYEDNEILMEILKLKIKEDPHRMIFIAKRLSKNINK